MGNKKLNFICLLICFSTVYTSCKKDKSCQVPNYAIPGNYAEWFSNYNYDTTYFEVNALSNKGMAEKFTVKKQKSVNYVNATNENRCGDYSNESVSLVFHSNMYNWHIQFNLTNNKDSISLRLLELLRNQEDNKQPYMAISTFNLKDTSAIPQTISHNNNVINYTPELVILNNLTIAGKEYKNVFKMENKPRREFGINTDILFIYFTAEHGLLRFDLKDETEWEIGI